MITPDAVLADRPTIDWENEGGALASLLEREAAAVPPDSWRALMVLGAVVAVWRDLPMDVRRHIAREAIVATNWAGARDDDTRGSGPAPVLRNAGDSRADRRTADGGGARVAQSE